MVKMYRQGDILLKKIKELPKRVIEIGGKIIARGEATGHAHKIVNGQLFGLNWSEPRYIRAKKNAVLVHEEHDPIDLKSGVYEIIRQREFDTRFIRYVRD